MSDQMSHRERVMAALRDEEVDRPPVSMWRHFFDDEVTAEGMAQAMLAFQQRFDWDFMKVNPARFVPYGGLGSEGAPRRKWPSSSRGYTDCGT